MRQRRLFALFALLLVGVAAYAYWYFAGEHKYSSWKGHRDFLASAKSRLECTSQWENIRYFYPVLRPDSTDEWYTPIAYDLVYREGNRDSYLGLFKGKSPKLDTCLEKVDSYPSPVKLDPNNPPVAMWLGWGNFHVQTTDDPKGGVPLERLPLARGPLEHIRTKKK